MDEVLEMTVPPEELRKFENKYNDELNSGVISERAQFEYAWCLVRSQYPADIRKGILLLEDLYAKHKTDRRDYLYYLTIGNTRIKEYPNALKFCRAFLQIEPENHQVQDLEKLIKKKMNKEGTIGMALTGAVILAAGSLVALGLAISKQKNS